MMSPIINLLFSNDHKFSRAIKLDVFYTIISKKFVTSLLRNYDIMMLVTPKPPNPFTDLAEIWYFEVSQGAYFKYQVRCYFLKL